MIQFDALKGVFTNYEVTKLHIDNPFFLNSLIYASLLFVTLVTLKKKKSIFLDFSQTEQLRGLAMLFVVIGHFWLHVCNEDGPFLGFGDYSVTLFLLLSGYGLMSSNIAHQITAQEFFLKRIRKIFIPYWLVTIGIIVADYVFLQKNYHVHELLLTFAGINFSKTLRYFDYARWFITLLLVEYLIFFFCTKLWKPLVATSALFFFSLVLILLRHYELFPMGARHQLIAFPFGCLVAVVGPIKWWRKVSKRQKITMIALVSLAMFSFYLIDLKPIDNHFIEKTFSYLHIYIVPFLFCLLCILSISLLASIGYTSRFLGLCGCLSYELYLIHGPLLIKYNPIVGNFEQGSVLLGILLWLGMALGLAYTLKTGTTLCNKFLHQPT